MGFIQEPGDNSAHTGTVHVQSPAKMGTSKQPHLQTLEMKTLKKQKGPQAFYVKFGCQI